MSGCSYPGKHNEPTVFPTNTTILTILSFELTVFEMQCIFEIEGSVILVQSYKHLLYSLSILSLQQHSRSKKPLLALHKGGGLKVPF
jgi:hypothetical protein